MDPYLGLQGCERARPHPRRIPQGRQLAASHARHVHQAGQYASRPGILLPVALTTLLSGPAAEPRRLRRRGRTEQPEEILEKAAAGARRSSSDQARRRQRRLWQRSYRHRSGSGKHEAAPGLRRQRAARHLVHRRVVVIAEPHPGHEVGGVADKPGVAIILCRARLASGRARQGSAPAGAMTDDGAQHLVHRAGELGADDLAQPRTRAVENDLPGAVLYFGDTMSPNPVAAIGERRIRRDQLQQIYLAGTERQAHFRRKLRGNPEPVSDPYNVLDAGALGDLNGNRVDRLRQPLRKRHLALVAAGVIAWFPAADADRCIDELIVRPQTRLQPSEVYERLKCGAGLALRLCRAVELAFVVVAATDHRAHRAG